MYNDSTVLTRVKLLSSRSDFGAIHAYLGPELTSLFHGVYFLATGRRQQTHRFVGKSMPSVISVCGAVIRWTLLFSDLSALSLIIAKVFYSTFDFLFR